MENSSPLSPDQEEKMAREIIEYLLSHLDTTKKQLTPLKCRIGKKYHFPNVMKNSIVAKYATSEELDLLGLILRRRPSRTLSGVTIVAVMTKPYECPGNCVYCPGPDSQPGEKVAQSYTGREPAAMRSAMYHYDGYEQTIHRLMDLKAIGHEVDKIELIIMGGTFFYFPQDYQLEFMQGCYDAIINFREPEFNQHQRSASLEVAKTRLESASTRLIGVTFETRPDYCTEPYVNQMLALGATRVEIGIQTTRADLLAKVNRGHTIEDSIHAIRVAKDSGLKVNAHMMPNLPGTDPEQDFQDFMTLFDSPAFRPDMMKIYPTLVVEGTKLFEMYQKGLYKPYSQEKIVEVIARIKQQIPTWVRIQRIQRDIPANLIIDGVKNSNLRQLVQDKLQQDGAHCNCIRCREEGFWAYQKSTKLKQLDLDIFQIFRQEYEASEGTEIFISYENPDQSILVGFLRLRFPSSACHRPEINSQSSSIVREIRVVGQLVRHKTAPNLGQIQHRGIGKLLMNEAERLTQERKRNKILVISGIGVRKYFYNLGYQLDGPYVSKTLD